MDVKISVIMSTLNTSIDYLKKSIESILEQSFEDFEFIIVCDGSEEEYKYIKENYKDDRIKLILHEKNMGLPYSLNEAIEVSKGKYIVRMDSDDISLNERLKIQYDFMEKNQNICIAGMYAQCFGEDFRTTAHFLKKPKEIEIQLLYITYLVHPTVIIRKSFLIDNKLKYNVNFKCSQDYELWSRCANSDNIALIPKVGIYYRIHKNQAGQAKKELQLKLTKEIFEKNSKKALPHNKELACRCFEKLYGIEKVNKDNYKKFLEEINIFIDESTGFDKKMLRNVLYNRALIILVKSGILKEKISEIISNNKNRNIIFNFTNIKYMCWYFYNKILMMKYKKKASKL